MKKLLVFGIVVLMLLIGLSPITSCSTELEKIQNMVEADNIAECECENGGELYNTNCTVEGYFDSTRIVGIYPFPFIFGFIYLILCALFGKTPYYQRVSVCDNYNCYVQTWGDLGYRALTCCYTEYDFDAYVFTGEIINAHDNGISYLEGYAEKVTLICH